LSRGIKGTNLARPSSVAALKLGMIWTRPVVSLLTTGAPFAVVFGLLGPWAPPFSFDRALADRAAGGFCAAAHLPAVPSAVCISETSIWSWSFERTST
jgi:hypothetical protein